MIDYIKAILPQSDTEKVLNNRELNVFTTVEKDSGEVVEDKAKKDGILIHIKNGQTRISLSLHKLFNLLYKGVNNNSGGFSFNQVQVTLRHIERLFGIPLSRFRIENIEMGINFQIENVEQGRMLDLPVIHRGSVFSSMTNQNGRTFGMQCKHQQYTIKLYNKSKQLKLDYDERRFELKIRRMAFLSNLFSSSSGTLSLQDLTEKDNYKYFKKALIRVFNEILFYQHTDCFQDLSQEETEFIKDASNECFWRYAELHGDDYTNTWRKYNRLVEKKYACNTKKEVLSIIENKLDHLIYVQSISDLDFFTFFNPSIGISAFNPFGTIEETNPP